MTPESGYTYEDALRDVCRRFCVAGMHDDACLALRSARDDTAQARAEALRDAADEVAEGGGAWDVLALYVDEAGHPYALDGIRRWLRERADRVGTRPGRD